MCPVNSHLAQLLLYQLPPKQYQLTVIKEHLKVEIHVSDAMSRNPITAKNLNQQWRELYHQENLLDLLYLKGCLLKTREVYLLTAVISSNRHHIDLQNILLIYLSQPRKWVKFKKLGIYSIWLLLKILKKLSVEINQ